MPQLPSVQFYINSEETDTNSPTSEATLQKLGQAINFLNDRYQLSIDAFLSNGTFTAPAGVDSVLLVGCGGGGGGVRMNNGGRGSNGAILYNRQVTVTPLSDYNVIIGGGGSGSTAIFNNVIGGNGGNTTFGSLATFEGASGGNGFNGIGFNTVGYALNALFGDGSDGASVNQLRGVRGVTGAFRSNGVVDLADFSPRPNNGFIVNASTNSGNPNMIRGGTGPFGLGGAGTFTGNGSSASANTGAGGGNSTAASATGGNGGSGVLYVIY